MRGMLRKGPSIIFRKGNGEEGRNTSSLARFCLCHPTINVALRVVLHIWTTL